MLNRKKVGFILLGLIAFAAIYYFTVGSAQITAQMKKELNTELALLQKEGFGIHDREEKENKEHFVISFDDPIKVSHYLTRQGVELNTNDADMLTGLNIGVDVSYGADAYGAVALDVYPVTLPTRIIMTQLESEDKKLLTQVQKMLDKKTFLMHITVNQSASNFKGYIKDIDETLQGEKEVKINMIGLVFSGDLEDDRIHTIKQTLKDMSLSVSNEGSIKLAGLQSKYALTGATPYDYTAGYTIEKMEIIGYSDFNFLLDDFTMRSSSAVKDKLLSETIETKAKLLKLLAQGENIAFQTVVFDMQIDNVDIDAFEKLQQLDANNQQERNILLQELTSKGISLEIPIFSVEKIETAGQKVDGFRLNTNVNIAKSLDITQMQINPMVALNAIDTNLSLSLSTELFNLIAQQPQAMMALMLFQPKDEKGKKVYKIELKNGELKINGVSMK